MAPVLLGLLLGACGREDVGTEVAIPAKPMRIMSTNMCTDLLLLMLVPRDRIASVTFLAHDAVEVIMPGADRGVAINHGTAEEVVAQQPDLILASPWSTPVMRQLAASTGAPLVEIDSAASFADIRRVTRQMGDLVGEPARAEALVAEMDRKLADLAANPPAQIRRVVVWEGDGNLTGSGTLTDEIIRAAGANNIAGNFPAARHATYSMEELLQARPDAILQGESRFNPPSLRESAGDHRLIRTAFKGRRITYPAALHACGLPQAADAARQLRAEIARVPSGPAPW
ncbi:ABC transporter substrate-binding protein [Altererythrobacter xixiisoli]|uniref:ABC transporter substrate-binding protein n=2 Tax=Croceibacterium xixiisoli TaxID=1476466 RepID=A0A6I4TQP6_9SPHN|nr:ABC transporter substrate-binding protein [Croceibacterium xixiisoli]